MAYATEVVFYNFFYANFKKNACVNLCDFSKLLHNKGGKIIIRFFRGKGNFC